MLRREELAAIATLLGVVIIVMGIWGASTSQTTNVVVGASGAGFIVNGAAWWQALRRR
jgi:uncharacterized membrane protein